MKRNNCIFFIIILVLIAFLLFLVTSSSQGLRIGFHEEQTDTSWKISYLYLDTELSRTIAVKESQSCVLDYETNGGSYFLEITDTSGNILESTVGQGDGNYTFQASSDLTIRIRAEGHSGSFSLVFQTNLDTNSTNS